MRESEEENSLDFAMPEGEGIEGADDAALPEEDAEEFDAHGDDDSENLDKVVSMSGREQAGCNFAIRRAIERRMEQKALDQDLDYLDGELDD